MMDPILEIFEEVAEQIVYHPPQIPFISNLDGALMESAPDARYWREHIRRPVYFADGMQNMHEQGVRIFLELGPQPHLLSMGRRCLLNTDVAANLTWLPSLRPPAESWEVILESLGRLYQSGFDVDWRAFDEPYSRKKVTLPNYPFDRQRYWLEEADSTGSPSVYLGTRRSEGATVTGERIYSEPGMAVNKLATAVPLFEVVLDNRTTGGWTMAYNRALRAVGGYLWGLGEHQTSVMVSEAGQQPGQVRVQMSLTLLSEGTAVVQLFRQEGKEWAAIGSGQLSRGRPNDGDGEGAAAVEGAVEAGAPDDVLSFLVRQASAALGLSPQQMSQDQPLDSLGMDSLMAIEMRSAIEREWQVTLPVVEFLQGPTLLDLAARIESLLGEGSGVDSVERYEGEGPHPLTHSQQAMWFLHELLPDDVSLNVSGAVRLVGALDTAALEKALSTIIDRHPALRTTYSLEAGVPVQNIKNSHELTRVITNFGPVFNEIDAADWDRERIKAYLEREANRPFDLERGPLIRLVVLRRSDEEHMLLQSVNHIAADFWSMSIILQELYLTYSAEIAEFSGEKESTPLPEQPLQYTDFARWHREMLAGPEGERLRDYWLAQLGGELPLLDLPTDRPRPTAQQFNGGMAHLLLPEGLGDRLHILSQEHGATLYMTLLAAFQTLLHRYSGQDDLLVGSVLAGRDRPELAGMVGYFINPVAMRANFKDDPTFVEFLAQVRERVLGALDHQAYPLPLLAERLQFKRDPGRPPIFETMFIMQRAQGGVDAGLGENLNALALGLPGARLELGSLAAESLALDNLPAQFDLTLMMTEVEDGLAATLHYNSALFDRETAEQMLSHLETLLVETALDPERPLSTIPLLPDDERERLLVEWNDTVAAYPAGKAFFQLFEEQAARTPHKTAVMDGAQSLTYEELNQRANRLAYYLWAKGVDVERLVGVAVERSADMVTALLAVHKAGGAYIPLDPAFPEARLAMMLEDAAPAVLLTETSLLEDGALSCLKDGAGRMQLVCLDGDWAEIDAFYDSSSGGAVVQQDVVVEPDGLAYIIYTSGSTGRPKGVQVSHRALVNFLATMAERPGMTAEDSLLAVTTLSFDIAGLELFLPLMLGATVLSAY
jgi:non-ribosomal peptide synthetase component F/acyl carrier protein